MPRYYFNLFNDSDAMDEEGSEHADLAAATAAAMKSVRELIAAHVVGGRPIDLHHRIEVTESDGKVAATVRFGDAITINDG